MATGTENDMIAPSRVTEDVAGLDIADGYITAARFKSTRRGGWELRNAGWVPYDSRLSDKELVAKVRTLWRQCKIPTTTVCSCMRSRAFAFHYFKYAKVSKEELASALWLQGEEMLQMPRKDIAIDWRLNRAEGNSRDPSGETATEGILFAAPLKAVEHHLEILEMAGLYPVILDVGSLAIGNLFLELRDGVVAPETLCLMNLSDHVADVVIFRNCEWIYPHTIVFRTATWEQSMAYLCESVNDVLKYYQYKLRQEPVTRLVITGRIPAPEQLPAILQKGTGLPTEIWNPLPWLKVGVSGLARQLASDPHVGPLLATSLGLAMRRD